jgi:hypothetical protein
VTLSDKDCKTLGPSGWGVVGDRYVKANQVPPWGRREWLAVLNSLLVARQARATTGRLAEMEADIIRSFIRGLSDNSGW